MARKKKELSLDEKRAVVQKLSEPGSSVRQMGDWYRRDGEGPAPEAVERAVERYSRIPPEIRAGHRLIISKQKH